MELKEIYGGKKITKRHLQEANILSLTKKLSMQYVELIVLIFLVKLNCN